MTTRSFLKGVLATPILSLASDSILPTNQQFYFHGKGDTSFKQKNYLITTSGNISPNRLLTIGYHYTGIEGDKGVKLEKNIFGAVKDPDRANLMDSEYFPNSDPNYPPCPTTSMILNGKVSQTRKGTRPFLLLNDFCSLTEEERQHYDSMTWNEYAYIGETKIKLKNPPLTIDVFTDINSFKNMLDIQYGGDYTQEFLDDVERMHF
jgi:hypothetical protein